MTRKECIDNIQKIIDENMDKILVRVHVGYLIHAVKYMKKQELLEPIVDSFLNRRCPKCNAVLKGRFCFECGQEVKWRG